MLNRELHPTFPTEPSITLAQVERESFGVIMPRAAGSHLPYERAALVNALEDGLLPDEVLQILAGRSIAEAFPVRWGESEEAYASRAVSEMFVSYLQ